MILDGFMDELQKLGGLRAIAKTAYGGGYDTADVNVSSIPHSMMADGQCPPADLVSPVEAATRIPLTASMPSTVSTGTLGRITDAKNPIDRFKYNRPYRDNR